MAESNSNENQGTTAYVTIEKGQPVAYDENDGTKYRLRGRFDLQEGDRISIVKGHIEKLNRE